MSSVVAWQRVSLCVSREIMFGTPFDGMQKTLVPCSSDIAPSLDMEEAERREVAQARFTSLDRILSTSRPAEASVASSFEVCRRPDTTELSEFGRAREQRLVARLNYLTEIGLAERIGPLTWKVQRDFESALRTFQRAGDRQKMLAQHAAFLSDPRLQYRVLTPDTTAEIDRRVIAHVLDEISGRPNALIEGVEGIVYKV